ncbi:hypothetical protein [Hymenobacter terrestris]|uniref:Outer membrane protein beta-barrel domain-containing protein n=1 Tax=Hymenobacter terrestris TaxID=2748310 RepID=A0ABX2Q0B1_9BACT|nr:hypothetical protein [Hymenobacter terrestris]NVO84364.1 hypothetical protein [Hymenobacter terrestris]
MRYRYLTTALLLMLLAASGARAQGLPGYVLTLGGDTLHGTLAELPQQRQVHLLGPDGQLQQFDPTQIQGYGLRGQALVASAVVRLAEGGTARYFVLPRLLGPAALYAFANETGLLLQPPSPAADTLYELNAYNWHLLFNSYLAGCPDLNLSEEQVLRLLFEERYVGQLLSRYNRCVAPGWQPAAGILRSTYRHGLGLEADFSLVRIGNASFEKLSQGTSQRVALAWNLMRASGLQTDLGLGYTHLAYRSDFRTEDTSGSAPPTEEQERGQFHFLTGLARISQRLGKPGRPGLLMGLELGFNYRVHNNTQIYRRPRGGGPTVLREQYSESGNVTPHLAVSVGMALPLPPRQEVRLSAFYQRYFPSDIFFEDILQSGIQTVGIRAAYTLFRE